MTIKNIFKVHIFYYLTALIAVFTGHFKEFLIFTLLIIFHELGHILFALIYKWHIEKVILLPFGALTLFNDDINKPLKEEFIILIMGPLFQVIFTFLLFLIFKENIILKYSKVILSFNLLPIYPLDGSKLINICLNKFISFKKSHLITLYISFFTIFCKICFNFDLIFLLIISFTLFKVINELRVHDNIFNRFLFERFSKNFDFKKSIVVSDIKKMKRDFRHVFYEDNKYITEREKLKKRFDFKGKL